MATIVVRVNAVSAKSEIRNLKRGFDEVDDSARKSMKGLNGYFKGLGISLATITAGSALIAHSFIGINRELERQAILLESVTGSAEAGTIAFSNLINLANEAPFSLDSLSDSFTRMTVSGIDPMDGSLRSLTDAISAFGGNSDDLKFATLAIQQMSAKGVVSMEELRRQLAERIPSAVQDMAAGLGMTYDELVDKVSSGQQKSEEAIDAMLNVFDQKYAGSGRKLMKSFDGAIRQLGLKRDVLFKEFADAGIWDAMVLSINSLSDTVGDLTVNEEFMGDVRDMSQDFASVVKYAGELVVSLPSVFKSVKDISKEFAKDVSDTGLYKGLEYIAENVSEGYTIKVGIEEGYISRAEAMYAGMIDMFHLLDLDHTSKSEALASEVRSRISNEEAASTRRSLQSNLKEYSSHIQELQKLKSDQQQAILSGEAESGIPLNETERSLTRYINKFRQASEALSEIGVQTGTFEEYHKSTIESEIGALEARLSSLTGRGKEIFGEKISQLKEELQYLRDIEALERRSANYVPSVRDVRSLSAESIQDIEKATSKLTLSATEFKRQKFETELAAYMSEVDEIPPVLQRWIDANNAVIASEDQKAQRIKADKLVSSYVTAYNTLETVNEKTYEVIAQKYLDDKAKFIAAGVDKVTAHALYLNDMAALDKKTAGESSADDRLTFYQEAYSGMEQINQKTYDVMIAKYKEDRDAQIQMFGDKQTAYAIYVEKLDELNEKAGLSFDEVDERAEEMSKMIESSMTGWANGFANTLNEAVWSADISFASIAESFAKMITEMVIQMTIVKPLVEGLMGATRGLGFMGLGGSGSSGSGSVNLGAPTLASAKGNVFASSPGISAYSNSVVSSPTVFPFAKGIGLMGEAGAEAIMPLTRNSSGTLVGDARGLGGCVNNIEIVNNVGASVSTEEKPNDQGGMDMKVVLDKEVSSLISKSGSASNRAMMSGTSSRPPVKMR